MGLWPDFFDPWEEQRRRERQRHPNRHHFRVLLTVNGVSIFLQPEETTHMAVKLSLGHTLSLSLAYTDQHGNPMLTKVDPDGPPQWSDTTPATETLTVAADSMSATGTPLVAGSDTVNVSVVVGGQTFTASLDVTVIPEAQVVSGVAINATVS